MVVMAGDGPSPHSPSLHLGLPAPQPSRRHHAQSLLGPSFHDPRTHHVLESHLEQAVPLSRCDDERWHAIGSHSAHALRLHLAACSPSSSCRFWVLDHLCSNLSQSFHLCCWITEMRSLNLCACFTFSSSAFAFLIEMKFSFKSLFAIWSSSPQRFHYYFFLSIVSWQHQKYWTTLILVLCLLCVTPLVCSSYSSFAPSLPFFSSWRQKIVSYLHIRLFSNVLHRRRRVSPRRPMYLLIERSKRPFRGSRSERLDDASVLLVSLIFLYPQKILISVRWPFEL